MVISSLSFLLEKFSSVFHLPHYSYTSAFIFLFFSFTAPHSFSPFAFWDLNLCYLFSFWFYIFFFSSFYFSPTLNPTTPSFLLRLPTLDILCKELSGSLDLTRSSLTKRLRKTRYYVLSYTFCNRPSNLVTTVQFKPGLKATKIAPNAN